MRNATKVLAGYEMPSAHSESVHDKFAIDKNRKIKTKPALQTISINPNYKNKFKRFQSAKHKAKDGIR
ncbi:MAG: hypothetical protein WKF36_01585 [Candidatus Nitrosocosmicus sp.]